ncbi:MAG: hypothetical protein K0Q49_2543, partial [Haloplasmataceae bacterium]|nr:hypothetical protein [Haloplasmataceae bacterium]
MKRRLGFLVLLFTLIFLSGCELLQQITYQDIGDQNVVMKIRMQYYVSNQIDLDETVNAY